MTQTSHPTFSLGPVASIADDGFPLRDMAEDGVENMIEGQVEDLDCADNFLDPEDRLSLLDCIVDDLHSAITL